MCKEPCAWSQVSGSWCWVARASHQVPSVWNQLSCTKSLVPSFSYHPCTKHLGPSYWQSVSVNQYVSVGRVRGKRFGGHEHLNRQINQAGLLCHSFRILVQLQDGLFSLFVFIWIQCTQRLGDLAAAPLERQQHSPSDKHKGDEHATI